MTNNALSILYPNYLFKKAPQKKPVALQNLDPHQVTFVGFSRRFLAPHKSRAPEWVINSLSPFLIKRYYTGKKRYVLAQVERTLYNVILRIARNLLVTKENIKIESHPFYHIISDWFLWGWSKSFFFEKRNSKWPT